MVARWLENYFQFRGPGLHRGLASLPDARRWQRADAAHTGYTERLGTRLVPGRREDRLYLEQPPQCHECGRDWGYAAAHRCRLRGPPFVVTGWAYRVLFQPGGTPLCDQRRW